MVLLLNWLLRAPGFIQQTSRVDLFCLLYLHDDDQDCDGVDKQEIELKNGLPKRISVLSDKIPLPQLLLLPITTSLYYNCSVPFQHYWILPSRRYIPCQ